MKALIVAFVLTLISPFSLFLKGNSTELSLDLDSSFHVFQDTVEKQPIYFVSIHPSTTAYLYASEEERDNSVRWLIILSFFSPVILFAYVWVRAQIGRNKWESGVFPKKLAFKPDNLMQAYLRLAALMVKADPRESKKKFVYMSQYFRQKFPLNGIDFNQTLKQAYEFPIDQSTVTYWIKLHLKKKHQRIQILHFLVGLSFIDGALASSELKILRNITHLLELGPKELDSLISMHRDYKKDSYKERAKSAPRVNTSERLMQRSSKILGVSVHAGLDEIKKAYRKLAKLHHPDLFVNESEEQQIMAEERFVEVNKAYEFLLETKFNY